VEGATVVLTGAGGANAWLAISRLPRGNAEPEVNQYSGSVVLQEAQIYRFELDVEGLIASLEPSEMFDADDASRRTGRLMPGEAVGLTPVELRTNAGAVLRGQFEIRSAKFSDEQAFSRMLTDLAELSVEALHQGFAPSAGRFGSASGAPPELAYQQFAVLRSLMVGTDLPWALSEILASPHRTWESQLEPRALGRPLRGSSRLAPQLTRPGPRAAMTIGRLSSLPRTVLVGRTEETLDTTPNRFVRFVLEGWRALSAKVAVSSEVLSGAARARGLSQARELLAVLDEHLASPLFREVGRLSVFPGDNQVLRGREGYRQVLSAWALVESAVGLELDLDDPVLVSRRSVATLYEYWTFVRLATAVANACGSRLLAKEFFRPSTHGMSMVLRADAMTRIQLEADISGVPVRADLFFNKEFRGASWTRPMRPDASLLLRVPGADELWLHFDAKYRVDWLKPFDTGEAAEEEEVERSTGASKRTDLLKMHAYRDAIRHSAGSYVLFPGSEAQEYSFSANEFLPGLGAFPLRPDHGEGDTDALSEFVARALKHVAASGTRHRRATYWSTRAYKEQGTERPDAMPPLGDLPPADTAVLLGYVRSDEQWAWVRQAGLYNVRSGKRPGAVSSASTELDAALILLYGREADEPALELFYRAGSWESVTGEALRRLGYPNPRGDAYLVTNVRPLSAPVWLPEVQVARLLPNGWLHGRPYSRTWLDVVLSTQHNDLPSSAGPNASARHAGKRRSQR
jgi:hypothetical protein